MARIWRVYKGKEPAPRGPWADVPLSVAVSAFELRPEDFVGELDAKPGPRFGQAERDLWHLGYKHIVVEIEPSEGRRAKWKPGYYHSRVRPEDAFDRLVRQPFLAELGAANVLRVECVPASDSYGRDALNVTVVIAPGAVKKLATRAPLNALVGLQERLDELGDERTPIIGYATEAELAEDGDP